MVIRDTDADQGDLHAHFYCVKISTITIFYKEL